jgi:DNA-binding HxlR family transcriptional regulator/putative sterol carrier protein
MASYGQFCPVSKAAEVLCTRWTVLVVLQLLTGRSRFGDIQRGVPGCPPATLSKRLKELEAADVVRRRCDDDGITYELTEAGWDQYAVVEGLGTWGQRWVRSTYEEAELDAEVLLWDVRAFLDPAGLGVEEAVVQLSVGLPSQRRQHFWIVVEGGTVDLCVVDPERPADALIDADLRALTRVWMGDIDMADAIAAGDVALTGPRTLTARLPAWFGQHPVLAAVPAATSVAAG